MGGDKTLLECVVVPGGGTFLATEDENEGGIKELQGCLSVSVLSVQNNEASLPLAH